ncbi:hypothetical protein OKW22_001272 [Bacilli bacterium PM5-3]|nr:hypothetical protein [Bacilli bacterium PM5-3]
MRKIKKLLLMLAVCFISLVNVNAEENNGVTTKTADKVFENNTSTSQISYVFKEAETDKWYLFSKIEKTGSTIDGSFVAKSQTISTYSYDNTQTCENPTETTTSSCSNLTSEISYVGDTTKYPLKEKKYLNNKLVSQNIYVRKNNLISEYRTYTYHTNGNINKYTRYYDGVNLKDNVVSYNKIFIKTTNAKQQVLSVLKYEHSQLWNEKKATVLVRKETYSYHSNSKLKQRKIFNKSVKYNTYSSKYYIAYNNKGIITRMISNKYDTKGTLTKKLDYRYNKAGQLKSNKNGNAYRYTKTYRKGKVVKSLKYKYNAKGKAKLVK